MSGSTDDGKGTASDANDGDPYRVKDPQALAMNFARALENLGKAASAWIAPRERGEVVDTLSEPMTDMVKTLSKVSEYWMADPKRTLDAQSLLFSSYIGIWTRSMAKMSGEPVSPPEDKPETDKRFADPDWQKNPFFDFLRQAYGVTSSWAEKLVTDAEGLDAQTRHKADFYVRQIAAALSPANFLLTNPQVYRETVASSGANLVRGMQMLAEDIAAGGGELRLRHTDYSQFAVGHNMAVTPGKVVARNDLCEIIQYQASTKTVFKRPLLIVPPWINKYYILDLNPQKSWIKWCVDQGHTVFVISWVNPDQRHADKDWEAYIREGIEFGLETVETSTGEREVNAIGYCVGGTLLAAALALHVQEDNHRIRSATLFTAQVDFVHAGDLKVFVDEEQLAAIETRMLAAGYLEGTRMAMAFNMLRASELIWPYVVNSYLKGENPLPFDLLYWNSDSTRMTAANHSYYLRNCYLHNNLSAGKMVLAGKTLQLSDINIPVYNLATREDHIAPARSVFEGSALFGGPVTFVLTGSGHIAGVVNPPEREKYQYFTGGEPIGEYDRWLAAATETPGSWWPHWQTWVEALDGERVLARKPGGKALKALADAPGTYVLERS